MYSNIDSRIIKILNIVGKKFLAVVKSQVTGANVLVLAAKVTANANAQLTLAPTQS